MNGDDIDWTLRQLSHLGSCVSLIKAKPVQTPWHLPRPPLPLLAGKARALLGIPSHNALEQMPFFFMEISKTKTNTSGVRVSAVG